MSAEYHDPETVREAWNMRCPKCGADDRIEVEARVWVRLTPIGTDDAENGDTEWDSDSHCVCQACGHSSAVEDFEEVSE